MTSLDEHKKSVRELLKDIEEKIRSDIIIERQKLIGFTASESACDLFAILLHKKNIISPGFNVNHRFFSSEKIANSKFNLDFPQKSLLIKLMVKQEEYRILLCYGREKKKEIIEETIKNIYKIKEIVEKNIGEEI